MQPAEITNDIEPDRNATYNIDGLRFLKSLPDNVYKGALLDPPYSVEMCLRHYTPRQNGTAGRIEYWTECIKEIARVVKIGGHAISFGWNSNGIGKKRGFEIVEIALICHGALHNDTIITIDQKVIERLF